MSFLKDLLQLMQPVTPASILWLLFITVVLFSFFFFLGFEYSEAQHIIK